jgi:transcriptional regulator with XRE-family HTH domain
MIVKVNEKTQKNEQIMSNLEKFPYFTLKCKLGEVLKERGMKMQELSDLSGIRIATISELVNMKRSSLSVPHLLVIAQVLRITDVSKLFEFIMPKDTEELFKKDQQTIEEQGMLPEQDRYLAIKREQRKTHRQQ